MPQLGPPRCCTGGPASPLTTSRSEEHTSELQSQSNLVCRLLLEKKKKEHQNSNPVQTPATRYPPPPDRALGSYITLPSPNRPTQPGSQTQVMTSPSIP